MNFAKSPNPLSPKIQRHKAAIRRLDLSLPVKCLLRDQLLQQCESFFDFGCGHGDDLTQAAELGIEADGWDPAFRPEAEKHPADAVNLGYVLNVIEEPKERSETLQESWQLCRRVLVVAARIDLASANGVDFNDGVCTRIGTFQKFFTQSELREYIETVLGVDAIPVALGVFYVFRDEKLREQYLATRYVRRQAKPRKQLSELRFEMHREILEPLVGWTLNRGRLPEPDEYDEAGPLIREFGSIRRAFSLVLRVTGDEEWEIARQQRKEDLLVYMALASFRRRPKFSRLPSDLQRDIRAQFGVYKKARQQAGELLFRTGDAPEIDDACQRSAIGNLQPNSLWVHRSAIESLDPLLRIYEGCARTYLGEIEGANIVKLHRFSGKVSYFSCPEFDVLPHPPLMDCTKLSLRNRRLDWYDSSNSGDPLVLHSKDLFVSTDHSLRERFARLTQQEKRWGLLDDDCKFRRQSDWDSILAMHGVRLKGHRLVRNHPEW